MNLSKKSILLFLTFTTLFFSCSSSRFEFHSKEIILQNLSEKSTKGSKLEIVWFAQRKSFLGAYIQEVLKQSESLENGKGKIPSVILPFQDVMMGVFLKMGEESFPLGFFSDRIKREGVLPMDFLQSKLTLKIEEIGGVEGKLFLTAEKRAEDIGLEIKLSDSMNPPAEIIWWFPLERDAWNRINLQKRIFPYLSLPKRIFKVSGKIKFCRTRYGMRIMEEKLIFEAEFPSLIDVEEKIQKEIKEIKFHLKI